MGRAELSLGRRALFDITVELAADIAGPAISQHTGRHAT